MSQPTDATLARAGDRWMLWTILFVLIATPWPFGSRLPWAAMLSASVVIAAGAAWFVCRVWVGKSVHLTSPHLVIAVFLLWVAAQWLFGWTVYRHGTAYDGVLLLSYAIVFAACVELARDREAAYRLHTMIIGVGLAVGIFGLLQYLTWNGRLFWVFERPYPGDAFGPFNNRNYFAGYMLVVLSVAVSALLAGSLRRRRALVLYLTWLAVLSLLLCLSRGGVIGFTVASFAALLIHTRLGKLRTQGGERDGFRASPHHPGRWLSITPLRLALLGIVAAVAGILLLQRTARVFGRLETLLQFQAESSFTLRAGYWREALQMVADRPVTGFGLGTYVWVFPSYRRVPRSSVTTNAHNEYLEMAVETGLVGAAICAVFLIMFFRLAAQRLRESKEPESYGIRLGAVCSWIGICVCAAADFPTVIPAINYVLAVLAALAIADIGTGEALSRGNAATASR